MFTVTASAARASSSVVDRDKMDGGVGSDKHKQQYYAATTWRNARRGTLLYPCAGVAAWRVTGAGVACRLSPASATSLTSRGAIFISPASTASLVWYGLLNRRQHFITACSGGREQRREGQKVHGKTSWRCALCAQRCRAALRLERCATRRARGLSTAEPAVAKAESKATLNISP